MGMFFIFGIAPGRKVLNFQQTIICQNCGSYGRYEVMMTYMALSIFFFPIFRWNRQYYVKTSCCNATYQLDDTVGRRIARGEDVEIGPEDLTRIYQESDFQNRWSGSQEAWQGEDQENYCPNCGYTTREDYEFCPKCGRKLKKR